MDAAGSTVFDMGFWLTALAVLGLLVLSGFFSGSETALTAASRGKLRAQADRGDKGAEKALVITEDNERLIGSVLLGNNLVNILATSLTTALFTGAFGEGGVAMATVIMTLLVLIFAEVLPKTYAITNAEKAASLVSPVISLVIKVFSPVVMAVRAMVRSILWTFGIETDPQNNILAVREEISGALALGHSVGVVQKEDRDRLLGALDLGERTIEEIMQHRSEIEMIDASMTPEEVLSQALHSEHTRLPVFRDTPENIIGVIHAKDLLRGVDKVLRAPGAKPEDLANFDFLTVARKPYFAPETTTLDDQMRQFLKRHTHFALVIDEYGFLQGLITLEDILEEIVGEINDEFDKSEDEGVEVLADGNYLVEGSVTIRDLNRAYDWQLPDTEANTVAGLVIHEAQMIPVVGQVFNFHGFRFEILEREKNRITQVKMAPIEAQTEAI